MAAADSEKLLKTVLLEDTWEADDVKEECARLDIPCSELTVEDLEAYDPHKFIFESVYMCDTAIVQQKLKAVSSTYDVNYLDKVPSTYPDLLRTLMFRKIVKSSISDLKEKLLGSKKLCEESEFVKFPIFVKPVSNDKAFDGGVLRCEEDLQTLVERDTDSGSENSIEIWLAEVVHFVSEYRLFVGSGKCYGRGKIQEKSAELIRMRDQAEKSGGKERNLLETAMSDGPSEEFIESILENLEGEFMAIDVGLMVKGESAVMEEGSICWSVVEVNPPFALDDHGLDIESYCQYCIDACEWMCQRGKEEK
eukprot:TRINITY_DN17937_c0_g2_i1.p1 TRINITY_DN17937_c0_g2~~TRINITY_DN17937_c0_g2_i1.p1  ORF type:complete len:308 (+),score=44.27 TRINITY_DN17937_c0_g2_i1:61-984(+)